MITEIYVRARALGDFIAEVRDYVRRDKARASSTARSA